MVPRVLHTQEKTRSSRRQLRKLRKAGEVFDNLLFIIIMLLLLLWYSINNNSEKSVDNHHREGMPWRDAAGSTLVEASSPARESLRWRLLQKGCRRTGARRIS